MNVDCNELHASGAFYAAQLPLRLTAIIPHYNQAGLLIDALEAMRYSSRQPDEIIVVDDGSNTVELENARTICAVNNAKFMVLPFNRGVPEALNAGVEAAEGNVLYFGAADDVVFPNFFEQALMALKQHSFAGLVAGMGEWVAENGARIEVGYPHPAYFEPERVGDKFIPNHVAIYRNSSLIYFERDAGPFADWLLAQRVTQAHGACFTGAIGGRFNLGAGTFYHRGDRKKQWCTVIGKLIALRIIGRVQLHVLGMGAFHLLPAELRTFRRWCAFRWHDLKARNWRRMPRWLLAAWATMGGRTI